MSSRTPRVEHAPSVCEGPLWLMMEVWLHFSLSGRLRKKPASAADALTVWSRQAKGEHGTEWICNSSMYICICSNIPLSALQCTFLSLGIAYIACRSRHRTHTHARVLTMFSTTTHYSSFWFGVSRTERNSLFCLPPSIINYHTQSTRWESDINKAYNWSRNEKNKTPSSTKSFSTHNNSLIQC